MNIRSIDSKLIEAGIRIADLKISDEDRIWARYSSDKVDIGKGLAKVIRTLNKELPLSRELRALSIGSSAEPQFRLLDTAFCGGLYLLDIDKDALSSVTERIDRQWTKHVFTILDDYKKIFFTAEDTECFLKNKLGNKKVDLVTLHHSLYYCHENKWGLVFENIYKKILAAKGAVHAVLMSSDDNKKYTTTWLYNYFAGKYFGHCNAQNIYELKKELGGNPVFKGAQIFATTHNVRFHIDNFSKFMAGIWMILLYPSVHKYTSPQKEEITEFIYKNYWQKKRPLIQAQDHLAVYKGIDTKGLI